MSSFQVNEQEVISSLRTLAECLGRHGAAEWKDWVEDAHERVAGRKSPAVDWSDLLWFARLNYLPVLRFIEDHGARDISDSFEALMRALLPDWPVNVCGFTREGDRHDTTEVFGPLADAAMVVETSRKFTESYCASLPSKEYATAYSKLAPELRETVGQTAFARAHERAYARDGGSPLSVTISSLPAIFTGVAPSQLVKGPHWPKWVSQELRRSIVHVFITTNREAETGLNLALFLIESGTQYAVAKYEFFTA